MPNRHSKSRGWHLAAQPAGPTAWGPRSGCGSSWGPTFVSAVDATAFHDALGRAPVVPQTSTLLRLEEGGHVTVNLPVREADEHELLRALEAAASQLRAKLAKSLPRKAA